MQPDIEKRLAQLESKVDAIYVSVEKTRKYILWTAIITLIIVILPLLALGFIIPSFLSTYTETINTLGV